MIPYISIYNISSIKNMTATIINLFFLFIVVNAFAQEEMKIDTIKGKFLMEFGVNIVWGDDYGSFRDNILIHDCNKISKECYSKGIFHFIRANPNDESYTYPYMKLLDDEFIDYRFFEQIFANKKMKKKYNLHRKCKCGVHRKIGHYILEVPLEK